MIRPFVLAVFLLPLALSRSTGQEAFDMPFPRKVEDSPLYQALLAEKAAHWAMVQQEIRRALQTSPAEPVFSDLKELALRALTGEEDGFRQILTRLQEAPLPAPLSWPLMLRAQDRIRAIDRQLGRFRPLLKYGGELMNHYVCDTVLADVRTELHFYEIRPGDRLAEIGAGDERFAAAMVAFAGNLTLVINEIDSAALFRIAYHLQHNPLFRQSGRKVRAVIGTAQNTGFENAGMDKIIIRNAFHHFDEAAEMLQSIRRSLSPQGVVFLKELYREDCAGDCCEKTLPEASIRARLKAAGFEVVAEQSVEDRDNRRWRLLKAVMVEKLP